MDDARALLIAAAQQNKGEAIELMKGTSRNWDQLRVLVEHYISYQTAADALGGFCDLKGKYKP